MFLVSAPVFVQAPLVRAWPWLSLALTPLWIALALTLRRNPAQFIWGDLLLGFSWCWLAGSIYWGWFRWEPFYHLPLEAIGLPAALWGISRRRGLIGHYFYLGSLLGTAITDGYFYLTGLMDHWRRLMVVEPAQAGSVLHQALGEIQTPWGIGWAIVLVLLLWGLGLWALGQRAYPWQAFGGAVLSTILVDSLFWLAAIAS
ncbi:MAG: DUF3120 domain-containing protein [Cyanobacteriota bacterium]|nr:DUF3120 domain-containing protein [Cyanobacteriota bacterium]